MTELEATTQLVEAGYDPPAVRVLPDGQVAWIHRLMYTWAILVVEQLELSLGYDDRWCYTSLQGALAALENWTGDEPEGWIRHPRSGRRRPDGDAAKEFVNP